MSKMRISLLLLLFFTATGGALYSFFKTDNEPGELRVLSAEDASLSVREDSDSSPQTAVPVNLVTSPLLALDWKEVITGKGFGQKIQYRNGDFVIRDATLRLDSSVVTVASGPITSSDILRHTIEETDIDGGSITSRTIKDGSIRSKDLNDDLTIENLSVAGTLTLADNSVLNLTADSLDFTDLKDALTLDASTDISVTDSKALSVTNTGTGNSFVVNDQSSDTTPFVIDASGNVGIGTTTPSRRLDIMEANSTPQLRLSKSGLIYTDVTVDSAGDLKLTTTGSDIRAMSENLWICDNDGCPTAVTTTNPPAGQGNVVVENALMFGNSFSTKQIDATTLGTYDSGGNLVMTFDEQ